LQGFYIDRRSRPYPKSFLAPDLVVPDFEDLAAALSG
jgi:2-haloacid dehalogenase